LFDDIDQVACAVQHHRQTHLFLTCHLVANGLALGAAPACSKAVTVGADQLLEAIVTARDVNATPEGAHHDDAATENAAKLLAAAADATAKSATDAFEGIGYRIKIAFADGDRNGF
jgi:hypothetical protein